MKNVIILLLFASCTSSSGVDCEDKSQSEVAYTTLSREERRDIKDFQDSGRIENTRKVGKWIEYYANVNQIDSSYKDLIVYIPKGTIFKAMGEYENGLKTGEWTIYQGERDASSTSWKKKISVSYDKGIVHGVLIVYQGYIQFRPLLELIFVNGIKNGIAKEYDINHPYQLKREFIYKNNVEHEK